MLGVDRADGHSEAAEEGVDPVAVALHEVIVHGDDVDLVALDHREQGRERRDDRLALTGLHLGNLALAEHHAADELDVERSGAEGGAALGIELTNRLVDLVGNVHPDPRGLRLGVAQQIVGRLAGFGGVHRGPGLVVELPSPPGELSRIEPQLGVEDLSDADVPVHRLTGEGENLNEQIVGLRAVVVALAQLGDEVTELLVGLAPHLGLELVDLLDAGGVPLHEPFVARAEHLAEQLADNGDF